MEPVSYFRQYACKVSLIPLTMCIFWNMLSDCESVYKQTTFELGTVCREVDNLFRIDRETDTYSSIACAVRCSAVNACTSFTYDSDDNVCVMNAGTIDLTNSSVCAANITYGYLPGLQPVCQHSASCTSVVNGVRLCDGDGIGTCNVSRGRIEILFEGTWNGICDDYWNDWDYMYDLDLSTNAGPNNSKVVCTMLGYSGGEQRPNGFFASGGPELTRVLDNVACTGDEASLLECPRASVFNCNNNEDVGVECF